MKVYHGDNGIFTSRGFDDLLSNNDKTLNTCVVGYHNHNSGTEQTTQTVVWESKVMMIFEAIKKPEKSLYGICPMELEHDALLKNITPIYDFPTTEEG